MDVNWIFGWLALLLLLERLYKQITGKPLLHSIPQPIMWVLVVVSAVGAAGCFALAWHTFTAPGQLLVGSSMFWMLLGIFLTGLALAWLLPAEIQEDEPPSTALKPVGKQPLVHRGSTPLKITSKSVATFKKAAALPAATSSPALRSVSHVAHPAETAPIVGLFTRALAGARAQLTTHQQPVPPVAAQSQKLRGYTYGLTNMFVVALIGISLLAVGWQLGQIFAMAHSGPSVAVALPLARPTPTPTAITNSSLTEQLLAQTRANVPVWTPTVVPTAIPVVGSTTRVALAQPVTLRNVALKAKPAFEDGGEVASATSSDIEFRRANKPIPTSAPVQPLGGTGGSLLDNGANAAQANLPIQLLAPADGLITPGLLLLRWSANFDLPHEQHYEVVAWLEGQEPFAQGVSLAPLTSTTEIHVDLALLDRALGPRFNPGIYQWGVMLVQRSPYQRIALLSNTQTFYYVPSN